VAVVERLVVVGASAGGIAPLRELVAGLPAGLPAAVLVVVHLPLTGESHLPALLSLSGPLPASHPRDGQELVPGEVLVAPPDHHLVVRGGQVRLNRGQRENRRRPAIDPLFRTAAAAFGPGVVAVVLSGALDDGAVGAAVVAAQDGVVVVQDPAEARVSSMPRAALATVRGARKVATADLAAVVTGLVRSSPAVAGAGHRPDVPQGDPTTEEGPTAGTDRGNPAALGCPECQGGMSETTSDGTIGYSCHVGHTWSARTLLDAQHQAVESAIYSAAAKLLEIAAVHRRLAEVDDGAAPGDREEHLRAADLAEQRAERVQQLAVEDPPV
jgi:two-component system, chemotaxis family, protein-glutamate methylesterase/glutaminase